MSDKYYFKINSGLDQNTYAVLFTDDNTIYENYMHSANNAWTYTLDSWLESFSNYDKQNFTLLSQDDVFLDML